MPKPTSTASGGQKPPVPVGPLLPPARQSRTRRHRRHTAPVAPDLPDWNGLPSATVAHLICHYTRLGDVVVDLDEHPSVIEATRHLRRAAARPEPARTSGAAGTAATGRQAAPTHRAPPRAGRRFATLPRPEAHTLDLHAMTAAMSTWRPLLRPGGFLLAALTASTPQPDRIGHRSTVIAAASAAGLLYHQHIPYLLAPAPDHEPRTEPRIEPEPHEADDGRRLLAGRQVPTYRDLLAFAGTATGEEAIRG